MVLRDHEGQFLEGKNRRIVGSVSILEAETVGIQEAHSWIQKMSSQQIIIESNALLVVNFINKSIHNQLEVGNIMDACRSVLSERNNVLLVFIRRPANRAAHLMARVPCSLNGYN